MKKYEKYIKNGLFLLILLALFLPMLQTKFKIFSIQKLKGDIQATSDPYISKERWLSGAYQKEQEAYVKDSFGLREPLIRLHNQWNYTLFYKTTTNSVVIGRDGYLYEENYIKASLGLDFLGEDSIRRQVNKLKIITSKLKEKNIDLVVLLAPGKGSFYPDYFPEQYDGVKQSVTNAEVYKKYLKKEKINLLDAHSWFDELKNTIHKEHKLFSKTGIHWSKYGEYIVADSLIRYLANLTGSEFPKLVLDSIVQSEQLRSTDNDVSQAMNLIRNLSDFRMSYPHFHREKSEYNTTKVLTIADSYFWGMYWMGIRKDYFARGDFWYYYKYVYPQSLKLPLPVKDVDVQNEIEKHQVVLLICTDANLFRFGFGFIDDLYLKYSQ